MRLHETLLEKDYVVKKLHHKSNIKRRLLDLGIMRGATIRPVLESSLKGMRAYRIKGTLIGLRQQDAQDIELE